MQDGTARSANRVVWGFSGSLVGLKEARSFLWHVATYWCVPEQGSNEEAVLRSSGVNA